MKKYTGLIILALVIVFLIIIAVAFSDNSDRYIKEISFNEVMKKKKSEDTFILYIKSTDCEHCKVFTPRFLTVLKANHLKAYTLNIANLSDEDKDAYSKAFDIEGTPKVLFIDKGQESLVRIEGEQTRDVIKSKLEAAGYKIKN